MFGNSDHVHRARKATMKRHPVLSREDEDELVTRAKNGDVSARDALIASHLRFVIMIARRHKGATVPHDDLVQEGNIGLLKAFERFEPERGNRFSTYAYGWVRAAIMRACDYEVDVLRLIMSNERQHALHNIRRIEARRNAQGLPIDDRAIAEELGIDETDVAEVRNLLRPVLRLNARRASADGDETGSYEELLHSGCEDPETATRRIELRRYVRIAAESLDLKGMERVIMYERLLSERPLTLQEISERFPVVRERVRQIEERLKVRLRQRFQMLHCEPYDGIDACQDNATGASLSVALHA